MSADMTARDEILARVRANLGAKADDAERRQAVLAVVAARSQGPRPPVSGDLAARFRAKSAAMSSTVEELATLSEVPAAVARYLTANQLPLQAVCWQSLGGFDWVGAGLQVEARAANGDDPSGITGCFCAIAETGSLMLLSGPETAATTSLLPETHIAIVPLSRIVPAMEEGFALLRAECEEGREEVCEEVCEERRQAAQMRGELVGEALCKLPRAVNFVSGPSRTGDIEQTIVLGAHGPYRVHLLLVSDA